MNTATWHHTTRTPRAGLKDTLISIKDGVKDDKISLLSAAMSYYALFALVPAISAVVLIYAWVSNPNEIAGQIAKANFIPQETQTILNEQLNTLASQAKGGLGFGAIFAVLIALWGASKASKSIIESLNIIYNKEDGRGLIKGNALALGLTFLAVVMAILALGVIIVVPAVTNLFEFVPAIELGVTAASWFVLLGLFSLFLNVSYRFAPDRKLTRHKWISWGSVIAAVLWAIVSALFSWYAKEFGSFGKTYGPLSAMIVLMTWFYLSSFVILLGGEINAVLEQKEKSRRLFS